MRWLREIPIFPQPFSTGFSLLPIFTASELTEQITAWKQALVALATAQEYTMGSRRLRRADLPEIRKTLQFLEGQRADASGASRRVNATPVSASW